MEEEGKQTASDRKIDRNIVEMLLDDQAYGSKKNWKAFRDKLRLKRTGKAWTSSLRIPTSDIPIPNNNNNKKNKMIARHGSWSYQSEEVGEWDKATQPSVRLLPLETNTENEEETNEHDTNEQKQEGGQVLSLMALLSTDGSSYLEDMDEQEEKHDEPEENEEETAAATTTVATGDCYVCNVCKAKYKGTELGPCGHMFCKHCTKELHVSKGNCPTCNNFILEILDIF